MRSTYFLAVISLLFYGTLTAQSPYKLSWGRDGAISGVGLVNAVVASGIDDAVQPLTIADISRLNRIEINWFDCPATFNYSPSLSSASDYLLSAIVAAPLAMLLLPEPGNDAKTVTIMYAETMLFSVFLPSYAKGGAQRIRPFVYNPDAPADVKTTAEAKRSFYSGHTTIAFASAVFFSTVYCDYFPRSEWKSLIWSGSLIAAGIVGFLRYESGMHYPSDIIVGALVGASIGYAVPYLHRYENSNTPPPTSLNLSPERVTFTIAF